MHDRDPSFSTRPAPSLRRAFAWSAAGFVAMLVGSIAACSGNAAAQRRPRNARPASPIKATVLPVTLASPWGLAFLPDGRMLVTQKGGSMVIVRADGSAIDATLSGVPAVNSRGQGGLLDVALDPDFATEPWVYFTFSEDGNGGAGTALARGRLVGTRCRTWR